MKFFLKELEHLAMFDLKKLKRYRTPQEFYLAIKSGLEQSNEALISTMYFGEDKQTDKLFRIIKKRNEENKRTVIILDKARGITSHVKEIVKKYSLNNNFYFKQMNFSFLPKRLSEFISIFHKKLIMFDNMMLFTGCNLSNNYFSNRLDRYYSVEDKNLAKYLKKIFINSYVEQSVKICAYNVVPRNVRFDSVDFISSAINYEDPPKLQNDKSKILIYGGKEELSILQAILKYNFNEIYISTAYLNFPVSYIELLKNYNIKIIVSDPKTNEFNNYGMFCNTVTEIYKYSTFYTAKKLPKAQLYEFRKDGFTMHAKGIWAFSDTVCLTYIGSSNLNRRSLERDCELNSLLITRDKNYIKIFREEVRELLQNSKERSFEVLKARNYSVLCIILFFLINSYL